MQLSQRKPANAPAPRIAPLSVLPVFFELTSKCVIVAGGSAAAAWKAELLAAAGADVTVIAPNISEDMAIVIGRDHLNHISRAWQAEDLRGAAMAVGDIGDAQAFAAAARSHSVPVNIIDQPHLCQFTFGSIVNRSPVVVGVSTSGAAPVLGQSIRQKIETMLVPALGAWAGAVKIMRADIKRALPHMPVRRKFWQAFAHMALGADERLRPSQAIRDLIGAAGASGGRACAPVGRVTLVGAGPGDAELLTLKAVRALQSADVILFDDLISDDVLELARREARRMLVGKRGQRASCKQEDINALLLKLSGQGKHVVRLKSGDPMIFGRAGEEIAALKNAGIAIDIVPGVTTALAAAAQLGVSLTHRDHAQSVRFVTGHSRKGELPDLDWQGLADAKTTVMVYMGGRTAASFCRKLCTEGLDGATPVAICVDVSGPGQCITRATLDHIATNGIAMPQMPVLLGIGAVFSLANTANNSCDLSTELPTELSTENAAVQQVRARAGLA